jgi:hypothetical protein
LLTLGYLIAILSTIRVGEKTAAEDGLAFANAAAFTLGNSISSDPANAFSKMPFSG